MQRISIRCFSSPTISWSEPIAMRCVRFKHLNLLLYTRLTAVIACWLSTRHTSGMRSPKNSCTKSCTGTPTCLNPWLRATTSLSAVLHEVADGLEDLHVRGNTLPDFGLTSSKCIPLTLRVVQTSPFQSASVESSKHFADRYWLHEHPGGHASWRGNSQKNQPLTL